LTPLCSRLTLQCGNDYSGAKTTVQVFIDTSAVRIEMPGYLDGQGLPNGILVALGALYTSRTASRL